MMKKITARFISAIVGALFFFSLAIAIMGIIAARENRLVSVFGYSFAAVATDSMTPTIDPQDIVIARKAAFETIEEDDIIIFYSESHGAYFVHRVVEITPEGELKTKGDNPDAPIDAEVVTEANFYGKVVKHGKFFGAGKLLLKRRASVYAVIVIALLLIIVIETVSIVTNIIAKQKREFLKKLEKERRST